MAHFEIDPISFFIKNTGYFPTKAQQNIINTMDSCQFTIIPFMRHFGISLAVKSYAEWEFLYSEKPVEITYAVHHKSMADYAFPSLDRFRHNRGIYRRDYNVIEVESHDQLFSLNSLRGSIPSDVYIIDDGMDFLSRERQFTELMYLCRARIGQRMHMAKYDSYRMVGEHRAYEKMREYEGARFVIVTNAVDALVERLLKAGIDEELIGPVDMSSGGFELHTSRKIITGAMAQYLASPRPMTVNTGQIFQLRHTYALHGNP